MTNLTNKILNQIKDENIKPIPKWRFLLTTRLTWTVTFISVLVGGVGFSISLFLLTNNDIFSTDFKDLSFLQSIIIAVPIFWLIITLFFIFLAYYNFKHTEEGYKWNVTKIFAINLFVTGIIGGLLYLSGASGLLNNIFSTLPFYNQIADVREQVWMRPESGYLAGDIVSINTDNSQFVLKDLNKNVWTVRYKAENIRPMVDFTVGSRIKIIGEISDTKNGEKVFTTTDIRPWMGKLMGRQLGMQNGPMHQNLKSPENLGK